MAEEARSPLRSPSMRSQLSQIIQALQKQQEKLPVRSSDKKISVREVAVALMGATGAGKSTFIKRVTSADSVVVGSGLQSVTQDIKAFKCHHSSIDFSVIDTPGFNDTNRSDSDILKELANWLLESYQDGRKINGIIYLHSISAPRMEGSALRSLRMFRMLCGDDFLQNVILGTTFWDVVDLETGTSREKELLETDGFFKEMKDRGCDVVRISDDRDECLELLSRFAAKQPSVMRIQKELFEGRSFEETAAARTVNPELAKLQQENDKRMADTKHQLKRANTKFELEKAYSLQLERRGHQQQMDNLDTQREELKKEMAQQEAQDEVRLAKAMRTLSSQDHSYQLQLAQLQHQLKALKTASKNNP